MAFNDKEISTQDGRLAALYRLDWGRTAWFYTSADRAITRDEEVNGETVAVTYLPKAVSDSGMTQGASSQNDFQMNGPSDLEIVRLFRGSPPSDTITLTVRRQHVGEDDAPIYWKGTVQNVKRPSDAKCVVIGQPISASLKRTGLRLCWTRECPHFIYDAGCKVLPADHAVAGMLRAFNGNTMTVLMEPQEDGWFLGGYVEWEASDEGTIERRMIEGQENISVLVAGMATPATVLKIMGLVDFITIGDAVTAYPGCSRVPDICDGRFDNLENYGGFDKMPGKSPFNTAIW